MVGVIERILNLCYFYREYYRELFFFYFVQVIWVIGYIISWRSDSGNFNDDL